MKITTTIIMLILFSNLLLGQIKLRPNVIAEAEKLNKDFPKEDFVSTLTTETYDFSIGEKKVICNKLFEERLIALKENVKFYKKVFFNDQSEITEIKRKNYKDRKVLVKFTTSTYKSDGIFYDDASVAYFNFLLKTRGDNSTYKILTEFKDIKYVTKSFFHNYFPILESRITYNIPDWLDIEFVEVNFEGYEIKKTETRNEKLKTTQVTYIIKDCAAIKGGSYSISASQQLPHILVLSKSYIKEGKELTLFSTTQDLYDWYASLILKVDNNPEVFKDKVEYLIKDATTDQEKVNNIFYWVQDNIRYIAYEDGIMGFKPADASDVYTKKYGDCKGMANLTCSMLKEAGFDARLTWIGTRSIPYSYSTPSLAVDNHMITTLFLNDKKYFLDATEKGVAFGDYAHRIQGQDVLIEEGKTFIIDTIPEFDDKYNCKKNFYNLLLTENSFVGNAFEEFNGEEKVRMYRELSKVSKADIFELTRNYVSNYDKNIEISELKISDYLDRTKAIRFEYDIRIKNRITAVENEIYFSLEFENTFSSLKIEDDRNLAMDFYQKVNKNQEVKLEIPAAYTVDYLPKSLKVDNDEFMIDVKYIFDENTRTINYTKNIVIKTGIISSRNFDVWNSTIKSLKEIYNDQVILIKL